MEPHSEIWHMYLLCFGEHRNPKKFLGGREVKKYGEVEKKVGFYQSILHQSKG